MAHIKVKGVGPQGFDVEVYLVETDGTERPIPGVMRAEWTVKAGRAAHELRLTVANAELDLPEIAGAIIEVAADPEFCA